MSTLWALPGGLSAMNTAMNISNDDVLQDWCSQATRISITFSKKHAKLSLSMNTMMAWVRIQACRFFVLCCIMATMPTGRHLRVVNNMCCWCRRKHVDAQGRVAAPKSLCTFFNPGQYSACLAGQIKVTLETSRLQQFDSAGALDRKAASPCWYDHKHFRSTTRMHALHG
jgi:hypothetical protein